MKNKYDYHTVVIGAGRVGSYFAKTLSKFRAKILLVDLNENFGGKQLTRDIPIEILKSMSDDFHKTNSLEEKFLYFRSELNLRLHNLIEIKNKKSFTKLGIDTIIGNPAIINKNTLEINNKTIKFRYCVFAVGSRFLKPIINGLNNTDFEKIENWFNYDKTFNSVTIVGNDKTSLELAITLSEIGITVYLINKFNNFIDYLKDDLLEKYINLTKKENLFILNKIEIKNVKKTSLNQFQIKYELNGESLFIISDRLILGGTKKGNLDTIKSNLIFETNIRNFPVTDRYLRLKNVKNFYAIGSCMGPNVDLNQGIYQANIILNNISLGDNNEKFDFYNYAININAKIGFSFIGMKEEEIKLEKIKYHIFEYEFKNSDLNIINQKNEGFIRAYFDNKHKLLNISILGKNITQLASFFLWLYYSKTSFTNLNSISAFPFTEFDLLREMSNKYLFEFVYDDKKLTYIHKWYLKI